jgi:hypothetical protein
MAVEYTEDGVIGDVTLTVTNHCGTDEQLVRHALVAIALVWQRLVHVPTEIGVGFADGLADQQSGRVANGVYDAEANKIYLALGARWAYAHYPLSVRKGLAARVAAHEAMHAVQCYRAGGASRFERPHITDLNYEAHPVETEAHVESMDVLKGYVDLLTGSDGRHLEALYLGDRLYEFPATSAYTDAWHRVVAGDTAVSAGTQCSAASQPANVASHPIR